jgi:hypothetical protein
VGTWKLEQKQGEAKIVVEPFEGLGDEVMRPLEDEVLRLGRFLRVPATLSIIVP